MAVNSVAQLQRRLAAAKSGQAAVQGNAQNGLKRVSETPTCPEGKRPHRQSVSPSLVVFSDSSSSGSRERQDFFLEQADVVMEEAVAMRKLKKGYGQYGMTPWEVVHARPPPQLPRYHSCPCLTTVQPVS